MTTISWQHAKPADHDPDPHYAGTEWVCFACRQPVNDAGRKVNMTALRAPAKNDSETGLQVEGS